MAVICLASLLASACGGSSGRAVEGTDRTNTSSVPGLPVAPGPEATVVRREQEQLVTVFVPLTAQSTAVSAADELHTDKLDTAGSYAATVASVLARARQARRDMPPARLVPKSADMRAFLVAAIDSRIDAMQLATRWLAAERQGSPTAHAFRVQYLDAWNSSIGSVRGATNSMQQERELVGLTALPEDSLR
jgi:hypothetical protein